MADNQVLIQIKGDVADINAKLADLRGQIGKVNSTMKDASTQSKGHWGALSNHISSAEDKLKSFIAGLVGLAAAYKAIDIGKQALENADALSKLSDQTGVSVRTFSYLGYAAKIADTDLDALRAGLARMSRSAFENGTAAEETKNAYSRLGISVKDASGNFRNVEDIFADVAEKFSGMENGVAKTALALQIFGRGGQALIPVLNLGREGLEEFREEAEALGLVLSEEEAKKLEEVNDNLKRMQAATIGTANKLLIELEPALRSVTQGMVNMKKNSGDLEAAGQSLKIMLQSVASVVLGIATAFDLAGTAMGEFLAGAVMGGSEADLYDFSGKGKTQNVPSTSILDKKAESWGSRINSLWNAPEDSSKLPKGNRANIDLGREKSKAADQWEKTREKLIQETETATMDELSQKIGQITADAAKLYKQFEKVGEAKGIIAQWEAAQLWNVQMKQALELLEANDKIAKETIDREKELYEGSQKRYDYLKDKDLLENEKAINEEKRKRSQYLITDEQMHQAEISSVKKILDIEKERQSKMDASMDYSKWQEASKKITELKEKLKNLESVDLSVTGKISTSMKQWADDAMDKGKQIGETFKTAFDGIGESLAEFVVNGKSTFSDLANSIVKDLVRIAIQANVTGPLVKWASSVNYSSILSLFGSAKGNVFHNGQLAAFANGGVVYKPTIFPMASGAGLMGEAGPEAIMPLTRTTSGKLGVESSGSGLRNVKIEIVNESGQNLAVKNSTAQIDYSTAVISIVIDAVKRNRMGMRDALTGG